MAWIVLVVAGVFEVVWAIGLKTTDGFTRPWPSVVTVAAMIASVVLLGWSMKLSLIHISEPTRPY